mgnify:CR=1 FL=1
MAAGFPVAALTLYRGDWEPAALRARIERQRVEALLDAGEPGLARRYLKDMLGRAADADAWAVGRLRRLYERTGDTAARLGLEAHLLRRFADAPLTPLVDALIADGREQAAVRLGLVVPLADGRIAGDAREAAE